MNEFVTVSESRTVTAHGIFNTNTMIRQMMEDRYLRISDELLTKMWAKIDVEEFTKIVLTKNYSLYSIDNWSRKDENI